jgi:hypothetical protein
LPFRVLALAGALAVALTGAAASPATPTSFPKPPAGATVFSRQLGADALALGVVGQRGGRVLVQASVVGRQGEGVSGRHLSFTVGGREKNATGCGPGCYRAVFVPAGSPRSVDVTLPGRAEKPWHVVLPAVWPPPDGTRLLDRAGRAWRSLHSLTFRERLASGTGRATVSTWRIQAPDRVAYEVQRGWAGVVIGPLRWDRAPGTSTWQRSPQTPLHQPVPLWVSVTDAHVLGNLTVGARRAVQVSFFDSGSHAWFAVVLDRKTFRTLASHMVTNAHFMDDTYGSFNSTPAIVPPR